ncbi:unnamed protein product [Closterium sp. Naga37s-1]|nr:unnamed protein product [Closterium sp. Naga37s-1]
MPFTVFARNKRQSGKPHREAFLPEESPVRVLSHPLPCSRPADRSSKEPLVIRDLSTSASSASSSSFPSASSSLSSPSLASSSYRATSVSSSPLSKSPSPLSITSSFLLAATRAASHATPDAASLPESTSPSTSPPASQSTQLPEIEPLPSASSAARLIPLPEAHISPREDPSGMCSGERAQQQARWERNPPLLLLHGFGGPGYQQGGRGGDDARNRDNSGEGKCGLAGDAATVHWHQLVGSLARDFELYVPNLVWFGESGVEDCEGLEGRRREGVSEEVEESLEVEEGEEEDKEGSEEEEKGGEEVRVGEEERSRDESPKYSIQFQANCMMRLARILGLSRFDVLGFGYAPSSPRLPETVAELRQAQHAAFEGTFWAPAFLYRDLLKVLFSGSRTQQQHCLDEYIRDRPLNPWLNPVLKQEVLIVCGRKDPIAPLPFGKMLLQ